VLADTILLSIAPGHKHCGHCSSFQLPMPKLHACDRACSETTLVSRCVNGIRRGSTAEAVLSAQLLGRAG
jgi:hypothetical protein